MGPTKPTSKAKCEARKFLPRNKMNKRKRNVQSTNAMTFDKRNMLNWYTSGAARRTPKSLKRYVMKMTANQKVKWPGWGKSRWEIT